MDLFKLVGSIFIDTEEANDSLAKTDKKATSVGETLGKVGKGAAVVGTAVIAGASAVGSAMVDMASDSAQTMDVIDKASQRMDISSTSEARRHGHEPGRCAERDLQPGYS